MAAKVMAGERDPRINPRRGDVLKRERQMCVVTTQQNETSVRYGSFFPGMRYVVDTSEIEEWRKWAAQATVIHRAEDL